MSQEAFQGHIHHLQSVYEQAMQADTAGGIEAVLLHSGRQHCYFADDRGIPFQAYGHFCHWLPINRPDQFLLIRPGKRPVYFQYIARDFWHDQSIDNAPWWAAAFDIVEIEDIRSLAAQLPGAGLAYLGECRQPASELGIDVSASNPQPLLHFLDYHRAFKTDYELEQLREAARLALKGHAAARQAFFEGQSEYAIHMAYLKRCQILEDESPYTNIVALNDKAAILHYQHKRVQRLEKNQVLLIDAGCRINNYGSDITRTTVSKDVHPLFAELLWGMDSLERKLIQGVTAGRPYVGIHQAALNGVGELLLELEICKGSMDELMDASIPQLFMPHGIGHLLGVQVHDVGGHQQNSKGDRQAPPEHSPALRNTRIMAENMVFTIEPGCYFIPLLLEPQRHSTKSKFINWSLIDELYPLGGIRIEDNIRVTASGHENLSRSDTD